MAEWTLDGGEIELQNPVAAVDVRVPSGSVTVAVADGPARIVASDLDGGPLVVVEQDGMVTVRQRGPAGTDAFQDVVTSMLGALGVGRRPGRRASVTVLLPAAARVTARTVAAPVMFSGMADASADTVTGDVIASRIAGGLRVATVGGSVQAADVGGRLWVTTVSGEVTIAGATLSELRARTVSGDVVVDGELLEGSHAFQAVSGNLALRVRTPAGFDLDATTVSGAVVSDLGPPVEVGRPGHRRVRVSVGNGGARLRSHTVSGDLTLLSAVGAR